eukprot:scaffold90039_cov35-Tisochrysis_lutea.AAC.1
MEAPISIRAWASRAGCTARSHAPSGGREQSSERRGAIAERRTRDARADGRLFISFTATVQVYRPSVGRALLSSPRRSQEERRSENSSRLPERERGALPTASSSLT